MTITLKDVIALAKELPESCYMEAFESLAELKGKAIVEKDPEQQCPHCESTLTVRNGKNRGKQIHLCRSCKRTFSETSKSAIAYSHSSPTVWKQVINDTVYGVPLDETAGNLNLHHETVFNMRHKILYCIEQSLISDPVQLKDVCETDETYVLA